MSKRKSEETLKEQILALPVMKNWKQNITNRCYIPEGTHLSCNLLLTAQRGGLVIRPCDVPYRRRPDDLECFEYTLDFWPSYTNTEGIGSYFSCRSTVESIMKFPGDYLASDILREFRSIFFTELEWSITRLLWIGNLKNDPSECLFAHLPKDTMRLVLQFCGEEKLKFLPENENELQLLHPSKQIYIGWYGNTVDWVDVSSWRGPVWISFDKQHFVSSWLDVFRICYTTLEGVACRERETENEIQGGKEIQKKEGECLDEDEEEDLIFKEDWLFLECFDD